MVRAVLHGALALGVGAVMGLVYWLLHVESPAPGPIGLIGLLGIVVGEQGFLVLRRRFRRGRS
jgi:XapX domain-containing protein